MCVLLKNVHSNKFHHFDPPFESKKIIHRLFWTVFVLPIRNIRNEMVLQVSCVLSSAEMDVKGLEEFFFSVWSWLFQPCLENIRKVKLRVAVHVRLFGEVEISFRSALSCTFG